MASISTNGTARCGHCGRGCVPIAIATVGGGGGDISNPTTIVRHFRPATPTSCPPAVAWQQDYRVKAPWATGERANACRIASSELPQQLGRPHALKTWVFALPLSNSTSRAFKGLGSGRHGPRADYMGPYGCSYCHQMTTQTRPRGDRRVSENVEFSKIELPLNLNNYKFGLGGGGGHGPGNMGLVAAAWFPMGA